MGKYEDPNYEKGTKEIFDYLKEINANVVVCGGDSGNASKKYNFNPTYLSTGGGASLEYLEGKKLAYLRFGTDIFINSISQDVLAATLLEYLCGGAVILNGKWLDYPELDYYGIKCQQYGRFEELPIKIGDCIKDNSITLQEKNSQLIWKYLSWNSYEWLQLYV